MKKNVKILLLLLFFLLFILSTKSYGHEEDSIEFMEIVINIQENGDAIIKETWTTNAVEIPTYTKYMSNISKAFLQNIAIKDEIQNVDLQNASNWNKLNDTQKKNRFSVIEEKGGVRIYWNGDKPGFHTYTLQYIVPSFVKQYTDKQGFYFNFFTDEIFPIPYGVQITIAAPFNFTKNNIKVLKSGFEGNIVLEEGKISVDEITAFKTITLVGELKQNSFDMQTRENNSLKNLKKELGLEKIIAEKTEDKIVVAILISVSVLYIFLEGYYLIYTYRIMAKNNSLD